MKTIQAIIGAIRCEMSLPIEKMLADELRARQNEIESLRSINTELYEALVELFALNDYATAEEAQAVRDKAVIAINKADGKP